MSVLENIKDEYAKLSVWIVAYICITVLIALGKVPGSTIEYLLFYTAGAVGKNVLDQKKAPNVPSS